MTLFKTNLATAHKDTMFLLKRIANLIQHFSDRPLIVQHEPAPAMGEGTPFYHISYSVSILDRRHPWYVFGMIPCFGKEQASSTMVLVYDPHMGTYQMNEDLTDLVKETINKEIRAVDQDSVVKETRFID